MKLIISAPPMAAGKPSFEARVDDGCPGNRREPELDFDIKGVCKDIERAFKANRNGNDGYNEKSCAAE